MKKIRHILFLVAISVLFSACETDFNTTSPYKDITVVYGLLDQKDQEQFIKINKAFLGEGNALIYAQVADSSNYGYLLDVVIDEYNEDGNFLRTIVLDTTTIYNKEPGIFYSPEQTLYHVKFDQWHEIKYILNFPDTVRIDTMWLNDESTFKLKIKNPRSGKEIISETKLVHDFNYKGYGQFINFSTDPNHTTTFKWDKAVNGDLNEFHLVFHYREVYNNDTIKKSIELVSSFVSPSPFEDENSYIYKSSNFYTSCLSKIPYNDPTEEANVTARFTGPVETIVSVAEEELTLYMQVYEPSTSIVQEKPEYTNIENGIGIFSSRYWKPQSKKLHSDAVNNLKALDDNVLKFEF